MKLLILNAGSSSLKGSLFEVPDADADTGASSNDTGDSLADWPVNWQAQIDWRDADHAELQVTAKGKQSTAHLQIGGAFDDAVRSLLNALSSGDCMAVDSAKEISAVGHRIVHGGTKFTAPTLITKDVLAELSRLVELAPSHEPMNIKTIEIAQQVFEQVPQFAVFDTSFHATIAEQRLVYACPYEWYEKLGMRRFGFHGISHQYCATRAAQMVARKLQSLRIVNCHLGSGASLCAIKNGESQMTTMGYTPLEGLVMGTRCGSIDPGLILHLLHNKILSADQISTALYKESGLKGITQETGDMREIDKRAHSGNKRARLAFDIYIDRLSAQIASLLPVLGGLDVLVFTAGVGQNSSSVRAATAEKLDFLGIKLDEVANRACATDTDISASSASVRTLVVHTREDLQIARECFQLMSARSR